MKKPQSLFRGLFCEPPLSKSWLVIFKMGCLRTSGYSPSTNWKLPNMKTTKRKEKRTLRDMQYSRSVHEDSSKGIWDGQPGLGTRAEIEEVRTTRLTPNFFAALRTFTVPWTAGSTNSFCGSTGSSNVQGDAIWNTPLQPSTALATASPSIKSASKTLRLALGLVEGRRFNKWEESEPGKMEVWIVV